MSVDGSLFADDMYIVLWERYLYVVLIQSVVDTFQHFACHVGFLRSLSPNGKFEVYARVTHLRDNALHRLLLVHPFYIQLVGSRLHEFGYLL